MQPKIYNITLKYLHNDAYKEMILGDMTNNYYWSEDWSEEFYIELARAGFISTTYDTNEGLVLLPELQFEYAILDFKNLHISKKVKKLLTRDDYTLCFNTRFNEVIDKFSLFHKYNWLKENYSSLMKKLFKNSDARDDFKILSVELISKETGELIAGEIGYKIGKTYTSLSGFSSKEKKYTNYGTLQLILLAKYLQKEGFSFWNLGHPHMQYKQKLGSITHKREDFLARWKKEIKHPTL